MTVVETILVYVVAPLAVYLLFWALTYLPGGRQRKARYKPGQPWEHPPVWYEPHPGGSGHGPSAGHGPGALPGSGSAALGSSMYPEQHGERSTGLPGAPTPPRAIAASPDGATAGSLVGAGATAASRPIPGGPLGGARGTW